MYAGVLKISIKFVSFCSTFHSFPFYLFFFLRSLSHSFFFLFFNPPFFFFECSIRTLDDDRAKRFWIFARFSSYSFAPLSRFSYLVPEFLLIKKRFSLTLWKIEARLLSCWKREEDTVKRKRKVEGKVRDRSGPSHLRDLLLDDKIQG